MANMTTSIVMELVDRVTRPVRRVQQSLAGLGRSHGLQRLSQAVAGVGQQWAGVTERIGRLARRVSQHVSQMARRIERRLSQLARSRSLQRLRQALRGVGQQWGNVTEQAGRLTARLAVMGGSAAGAVWGVERLVSGVTDVGTAVQESAERLSVGTTWLQEWTAVGRRFGVQNDALVDGLKELGLRADEFVMTGGGPAAEAFERLGIGIEALRGTAGDTEALLDLVMGRLGDIENEAARQRIFDEIFGGQGGEQMVAMLSASREELESMMRAAHQRGEILSPEEIANSREYNRQMGDLRQSLFGIQRTVVGDLLPAITDWMERMRELATANREAVSDRILEGLRETWRGLQLIGGAVSWAADRVGGFGNLLAIVVGLLAGRFLVSLVVSTYQLLVLGRTATVVAFGAIRALIRSVASLTTALLSLAARGVAMAATGLVALTRGLLGVAARAIPAAIAGIRALSLAMLTTPVGWIITGIAAVAGAVYLIYRNWDGIAAWFGDLWESIKAWFSQGIGGIVRDLLSFSPAGLLMRGVDEMFQLLTGVSLSEIGGAWIDSLKSGINEQWQGLSSWLREKLDTLTGWLPDWAKEGLGIETANVPQPSVPQPSAPVLGSSLAGNGPISLQSTTRTEVGGELRITVDGEGRPRVSEARPRGGMGFDVESGILGVMP